MAKQPSYVLSDLQSLIYAVSAGFTIRHLAAYQHCEKRV